MSDEFMLKGLFPFFAAFFHHAGFDLEILTGAGPDLLKRGIQLANAPFCAPMQLFHGVAEQLAGSGADWLFVPMLRSMPRVAGQRCSVVCPIVQGSPKLLAVRAATAKSRRACSRPIIDCAEGNLESKEFLASCERLGEGIEIERAPVARGLARGRGGATAVRRRLPGDRPARAGILPRAKHRAGGRAGPGLHDLQQGPEFERAGDSARAGRDRHSGGLLSAGRGHAGVYGHVLGLRPEHPARGPSSAARGRASMRCIAAIIPAGRTVSICISRPT